MAVLAHQLIPSRPREAAMNSQASWQPLSVFHSALTSSNQSPESQVHSPTNIRRKQVCPKLQVSQQAIPSTSSRPSPPVPCCRTHTGSILQHCNRAFARRPVEQKRVHSIANRLPLGLHHHPSYFQSSPTTQRLLGSRWAIRPSSSHRNNLGIPGWMIRSLRQSVRRSGTTLREEVLE